jgi:hypothetical protein
VAIECIEDSLGERALDGDVFLKEFEPHGRLLGKSEGEIRSSWGEAMLATQEQAVTSSLQIEIGIAPGVKVRAASECLSWVVGGVFACVMDEGDGESEGPRKLTQSGENGGDLGGVVFVRALESDVGVEHEEPRLVLLEGVPEPVEMFSSVEP